MNEFGTDLVGKKKFKDCDKFEKSSIDYIYSYFSFIRSSLLYVALF